MQLSTYGQYLAAKKTVDDRALHAGVLARLREHMQSTASARPRVLEVGAGLGTMVARLVELGILRRVEYVLLDSDLELLRDARSWLTAWALRRGSSVSAADNALVVDGRDGTSIALQFEHADVTRYLARTDASGAYDVLIANAVLDLVDVSQTLPRLLALLSPGGAYWFSINFDGESIFLPEHPRDELFMEVYHRSMDERTRDGARAGDSRTGRHLFGHLRACGARILAAGSSDWVVFADQGRYPASEDEFLRHIVRTVDEELQRHPEVDPSARAAWTSQRNAEIERGELIYIAHQLDFLGVCAS